MEKYAALKNNINKINELSLAHISIILDLNSKCSAFVDDMSVENLEELQEISGNVSLSVESLNNAIVTLAKQVLSDEDNNLEHIDVQQTDEGLRII